MQTTTTPKPPDYLIETSLAGEGFDGLRLIIRFRRLDVPDDNWVISQLIPKKGRPEKVAEDLRTFSKQVSAANRRQLQKQRVAELISKFAQANKKPL